MTHEKAESVKELAEHRLKLHLASWLGESNPSGGIVVTTSEYRSKPGWEGSVLPVAGIRSAQGTIISVPAEILDDSVALVEKGGLAALEQGLADYLPFPEPRLASCCFRWCEELFHLPDAGEWVCTGDPAVPAWLHPYQEVLLAKTPSGCAGAMGIKHHDDFGRELAIRILPRVAAKHQLVGLGRRLTAKAARKVFADGAVPTVLFNHKNVRTAGICNSTGFPDRGWEFLIMVAGAPRT